jgi:hypothetical protein
MRRLAALAFFAAVHAGAQAPFDPKKVVPGPETRWFNLDKTTTGVLAAGNLAGTFWAMHVRGNELKRLAVTTFSVDGVILQVRAIPRTVIKGGTGMNALGAHKAYEQEHLAAEAKGTTFGDHDYCRDAKVAHQQWIARSPGGISQAFVTFLVGDYVMMIGSPYENAVRENAVARALAEVCATFRTEKNKG